MTNRSLDVNKYHLEGHMVSIWEAWIIFNVQNPGRLPGKQQGWRQAKCGEKDSEPSDRGVDDYNGK